jgi:hypothetical protein
MKIVMFLLALVGPVGAKEIPLSEVWAVDMPGTRDARRVISDSFSFGVRT